MSAREWKPGDVADRYYKGQRKERAFVTTDCRDEYHDLGPHWHMTDGGWDPLDPPNSSVSFRPLVVIDPEDREQMSQVESAVAEACGWISLVDDRRVDGFQQAFRDLADPKPPKPEEPTGLGAVVEEADGAKFARVADPIDGWMAGKQWQRIGGDINAVRNFGWSDLNAVRVLHKGVTS